MDARDEVARGGTGQLAPTALARTIASRRPTVLAGGLTSQNVIQRIEEVRPHGVDTASGVETEPGVKDGEAVRAFCKCAKEAFASMANGECDV